MVKKTVLKNILMIILTMVFLCGIESLEVKAENIASDLKVPQNVRVYRHSNTSLKIRWKSLQDADGYMIYRYSKEKRKYVCVKNIKNRNKTSWINKSLKTNCIYKYKIIAYKNINNKKSYSKMSKYVMAKTYERDKVKINAREPKVSNKKVYLGLCSSKKIKTEILASKYGTNENKRAFCTKVRWYSSNSAVAKVDKKGVIKAGVKAGRCNVYAVAHNGRRTKIKVVVKNYARAKKYYNCSKEDDLYTLVYEYTDLIQDIAEYFSVNRLRENESINIRLNDKAKVIVEPETKFSEKINREIEDLLVNFPYYLSINIDESEVAFISRKKDTDEAIPGYVNFVFDNDCSQWNSQIAPHWEAVRFYPM